MNFSNQNLHDFFNFQIFMIFSTQNLHLVNLTCSPLFNFIQSRKTEIIQSFYRNKLKKRTSTPYPWWQKSLAKYFIFQLEEYIFNCISLLNILLQVCLQPSANLSKSDQWGALNIGQPINSKWKDSSQENSKWKHSNQEKSEPNSEEHFVKRNQKTTDGRLNSVADSDVDKHGTKTGWDYAKSNLLDDEYRGIGNMVSYCCFCFCFFFFFFLFFFVFVFFVFFFLFCFVLICFVLFCYFRLFVFCLFVCLVGWLLLPSLSPLSEYHFSL